MFRRVHSDGNKQHLQNDLDNLIKWSEKWHTSLNFGKCKCPHTGHGNLDVNCTIGDTVLCTNVSEKDLGITNNSNVVLQLQWVIKFLG